MDSALHVNPFNSYNDPRRKVLSLPLFKGEETETQRELSNLSRVTYLVSDEAGM